MGGRISPARRHWDTWGRRRPGRRPSRRCPACPCVTRIPFGPCGPCGPFGLPVIAVLAAGPLVPVAWYARTTWTCRLICPQDARSPRAGGLCSRYGSLSQRYGSVSRQGREGSRTGGGRVPGRAGQDGQGTAGGCPGSEARGTSRPGQAGMGPGRRLGNRHGPPGAPPARKENGPGRVARQASGCPGLALAAAGRPRASREDHDLRRRSPARVPAGCRRSPGEVCSRTTNRQIPWQAETLARPEYSSRPGRSGHVLTWQSRMPAGCAGRTQIASFGRSG